METQILLCIKLKNIARGIFFSAIFYKIASKKDNFNFFIFSYSEKTLDITNDSEFFDIGFDHCSDGE